MRLQHIAAVGFSLGILGSAAAVTAQSQPARHDTTQLTRDLNERWQPMEARSVEIRDVGPSERWEEETIRRPDSSGALVLSERHITHRFEANGIQQAVTETFAPDVPAPSGFTSHMTLRERVRVSTTATPDGGRQTIEEVERRSDAAPSDPVQVVRRVVETVRNAGPDRWVTERQIFERDLNGRLVPIGIDREERVTAR